MPTIAYSEEERRELEETVRKENGDLPWVHTGTSVHKSGLIHTFRVPVDAHACVEAQCSYGSGSGEHVLYAYNLVSNDRERKGALNAVHWLVGAFRERTGYYPWEADEPEADEPEADEPEADEPEADEPEADEPRLMPAQDDEL